MQVNKQYYKYWKDLWSMQTEEVLDATALVRVMNVPMVVCNTHLGW